MATMKSDPAGFLLGDQVADLRRGTSGGSGPAAAIYDIRSDLRAIRQAIAAGASVSRSRSRTGPEPAAPAMRGATTPRQRDASGRFVGAGTGQAAKPVAPAPRERTGGRFSGALGGVAGLEEADPTVRALREVAQPLARGYQTLTGDKKEKKQEGWFKRILSALEEKKDGSGEGGGGSGFLGVLARFVPLLLPALATLTAIMAGVAAFFGIKSLIDPKNDQKNLDAIKENIADPLKEGLKNVGLDSDADIAARRQQTLEKRDGEYAKEDAARAKFRAPSGAAPGSKEFEDAFYRDQQAKEAAAAEQAKKGPLRRGWEAVKGSLVGAAQRAGVDPGLLAKIANFESSFNPNAAPIAKDGSKNRVRQFDGRMAISSAHGLGQFTDDTWMDVLNRHGAKYGVAGAGKLTKEAANKLRGDQDIQAAMLAELTKENVARGKALGGADDDANVYALHNLGPGDGPKLLAAMKSNPGISVRDALLQGAKTAKERAHVERVVAGNKSLYGDGSVSAGEAYRRMGAVMRRGDRFAVSARAAAQSPASPTVPPLISVRAPAVPAIPDAPTISVPLGGGAPPPVVVSQAPAEVGRDLRDRRLAHIATGGISMR